MEQPVASAVTSGRFAVATRIAVASWAFVVLEQVASLLIWERAGFAAPAYLFMHGPAGLIALHASLGAQAGSALVLTMRRPDNRVGWAIMAFSAVTASATPVMAATAGVTAAAAPDATVTWLAWLVSWVVFPAASFLAFMLAFIFPTGRLVSARWRRGLAVIGLAAGLAAFGIAVRAGPLLFFPAIANPIAPHAAPGGDLLAPAAIVLLAVSGILAGVALAGRYRVSDAVARVQIRWYIASGVMLAFAYVSLAAATLFVAPGDPLGEVVETLEFLVLGIPPIAITIAILRYRLYDIDALISRAFVYGALTAVLAGIYTASIRLFNAFFVAATGESSDIALVITTLILATTFTPMKRRLELIAERRLSPEGSEEGGNPVPSPAARELLDDPAFTAALDERIRAVLAERQDRLP